MRGRGLLAIVLLVLVAAVLLFSILLLIGCDERNRGERLAVALCSWLLLVPGISVIKIKSPVLYARFAMFVLLMITLIAIGLGDSYFRFPIYLIVVLSLWALIVPFPFLYEGKMLWLIIVVDLILLGAFLPHIPAFHYSSFLLLMSLPFSIITSEKGWSGGLAGFIPLLSGILYGRFLGYREEGLFLLMWAPVLGGAFASLGLFIKDYKEMERKIEMYKLFWPLGKEVLQQYSFKEAMETVLKYILRYVPATIYSLTVKGEDIEPVSLRSSKDKENGVKYFRLRREFSSADFEGEVILEREEMFSPKEEEIVSTIFEEVMPAIEKILYLEKAVEVAASDPLTSLANRRYFLYWLREDINRANRYKIPLSLLFLDIDGFKSYNDRYGHLAGDEVLRKIGEMMKKLVRKTDIIARYGGDEFAILFPHIGIEEARVVCERIRESIKGLRIFSDSGYITLSGGLTMYKLGERMSEFLRRADELLYQAKARGGDRIEVG